VDAENISADNSYDLPEEVTTVQGSDAEHSPYERLKGADPVMANRLHPNDTRRIHRALQVHTNLSEAIA